MKRAIAIVALSAAVLVPAATAKPAGQLKLSVLPLPKSSLGPAARGLRLEGDSGGAPTGGHMWGGGLPLSPNRSLGVGNAGGRLGGYRLDYGLGASGGAGVTEVWTSVDQYRTRVGAKNGLAVWKRADQGIAASEHPLHFGGLAIAVRAEKVSPVGSKRFAYLVRYRAPNIAPLYGVDEQFTQGRYQADVTVWAGSAAAAEKLAPQLAGKLEARIELARAGRLRAKPVKLPPPQQADPPPGGPDLSPLGLMPTDLNVQASAWERGYYLDVAGFSYGETALSNYRDAFTGQFGSLGQDIHWFPTANQASFTADIFAASFGDSPRVDLNSVGDGAQGVVENGSSVASLIFSSGRLLEDVGFWSSSTISTADVQHVARTVANRINAAGLGS